jgi:hypothetical protein
MNPRIQELAQAATTDILGVPVMDQKKFAELIVRECLAIVNRYDYSYHEADPLWETAQLIKQHFGIDHE